VATIWDIEKGQVLKTLKGHAEIIECSAFDRKGELVATADATGTVKVWTAGPGREVMEEDGLGSWGGLQSRWPADCRGAIRRRVGHPRRG
jgi:WD40 repeat protein